MTLTDTIFFYAAIGGISVSLTMIVVCLAGLADRVMHR
jgi:hypothetical protein